MSNIRAKITEALKKEPMTLSDLSGACKNATRKQIVDAANHAAKDGLLTKGRCDVTNEPLYTLTKKGREWTPAKPGDNLRKYRETIAAAQPQPEVGQNTGSLGSDRHLRADSLPEAQAVTQPPKPDEKPVEAGGDVTAEAAPITHHCTGDRCQSRQQCLRYTTRHKPARPVFAAFWARREAGASACDSFLPIVQVEGAV